nr:ATP-binding protein [Caldimonas mangrovi]
MAIFGFVIQRYIARPLKDVQYVVKGLVDGDMTRRLHSDRDDEVGQLVRGIDAMREQFQLTLDHMREAIHALSSETSMDRLRLRVTELLGAITGATAVSVVTWSEELRGWCFLKPALQDGPSELLPVGEACDRGLLPLSVFGSGAHTTEPLLVADARGDARFASDTYFAGQAHCSLLVVPIHSKGAPRAILLLENRLAPGAFSAHGLDSVMLIAGQLAVAMDNAQLYEQLEQRVQDRTRELQEAQSQLLGAARLAGMAEIATNVLHNVGNVLTSINISAEQVIRQLRTTKLKGLARAVQMMDDHADDLGAFLTTDVRGKLLPSYLRELAAAQAREQGEMTDELIALGRSVDHVKKIVATQQSYAGKSCVVEPVDIRELLDDALRMNAGALQRHKVEVVRELEDVPAVPADRHRLLQILVNLISNAKQALSAISDRPARITLSARLDHAEEAPRLRISVTDNGEGIAAENLTRIFSHGFSTRENGHGFGLHSCIVAAHEMGGTLRAQSGGPGQGATFTLEIPCALEESTQ